RNLHSFVFTEAGIGLNQVCIQQSFHHLQFYLSEEACLVDEQNGYGQKCQSGCSQNPFLRFALHMLFYHDIIISNPHFWLMNAEWNKKDQPSQFVYRTPIFLYAREAL